MTRLTFSWYVILVLALAEAASARTWHVPAECPTIQAGIDSASAGDTVLVADGTYTGDGNRDIEFLGKGILVTTENGPDATIIDCEGSYPEPNRGFYFHHREDSTSIVEGFTIRHGYIPYHSYGAAIYCRDSSSPTIRDNVISDNWVEGHGGGIACKDSCSPIIENNIIVGNKADLGGGIYCRVHCYPRIHDNTITENTAEGFFAEGGGIYCAVASSPSIRGNTITLNTAEKYGGGIYCYYSSSPTIADNTIADNVAIGHRGGGIFCYMNCSPMIESNLITDNTAGKDGGGVSLHWQCSPTPGFPVIARNMITGNTAADRGGGIFCYHHSSPTIIDNLFTGNTADRGGALRGDDHCSPKIERNTIRGNLGYTEGGGIAFYSHCSPTVSNSILWDDCASPGGCEIDLQDTCSITVSYCDVEGGSTAVQLDSTSCLYWGEGNIDDNPLFAVGPLGGYYLSQTAAGQSEQSPCVDAGDPAFSQPDGTTRTDSYCDVWPLDMGFHYPDCVPVGVVEEYEEEIPIPSRYLSQNYPNPFNSTTTLWYSLAIPSQVVLAVYDIQGAFVRSLVSNTSAAGPHQVEWDGRDHRGHKVGSGVYFCRLETGGHAETRRVVLLR